MPTEAFRRYQALRNRFLAKGEYDSVYSLDGLWRATSETIIGLEEALNRATASVNQAAFVFQELDAIYEEAKA